MLSAALKSGSRGFSLIELMIAITVMAILMGLAVPSFKIWMQNSQIRNGAESIQNGLQRARAEAVARNANIEFVLGVDSSWVVKLVGGANIDARPANEGSKNVTRTVLPVGATTVTFNNFGGVVANADASATLTQVDLDSPLIAAADSQNLRVTVGLGGNARMCDPNVAAPNPRGC